MDNSLNLQSTSANCAVKAPGMRHQNISYYNNNRLDLIHRVRDIYPENCAISIKNLCKSYVSSQPPTLNNFCMSVEKGSIYGLLGSSGCGKTTILSCIVGLRKWTSGQLLVFGKTPGEKGSGIPGRRVGYMPQDLALYNQLSIREGVQYYSRIYHMPWKELEARWDLLNELLELPKGFKLIGNLSGGQKRRASLALALVHSPELLILDEPTVGLDPLLRTKIWDHLYKIVRTQGTTILITTHYTEEARSANRIGVMRNGRLLVEDSPDNLLRMYECNLLEEVVLRQCRRDESKVKGTSKYPTRKLEPVRFQGVWPPNKLRPFEKVVNNKCVMDMGVFRKQLEFDCNESYYKKGQLDCENGTVKKSGNWLTEAVQKIYGLTTVLLLTYIRYPVLLAILVLMPSFQGTITLLTVGSTIHDIQLGIVNHDIPEWKTECDLAHETQTCDLSSLSCLFLRELNATGSIALNSFESKGKAVDAIHRGNVWGYVEFPTNYSQHTTDLIVAKQFSFNETIDGSRITVQLDQSQSVMTFILLHRLALSYNRFVTHLAQACNVGGNEVDMPIQMRRAIYGYETESYTAFIMPGIMLSSLLGILSVLTAIVFISDYKQGTLSRARVAGLTTVDIMISHVITQGLVTIAQILIWDVILHFLFGFVVEGPLWVWHLFCLAAGLTGAGFGIFLGIFCNNEVEALIIGVFLFPILLLYGGVFWPTEAMPSFWKHFGHLLPTSLPVMSLRSVITRGFGLTHATVWPGFVVLLVWLALLCVIDILSFKKFCK